MSCELVWLTLLQLPGWNVIILYWLVIEMVVLVPVASDSRITPLQRSWVPFYVYIDNILVELIDVHFLLVIPLMIGSLLDLSYLVAKRF